MKKSLAIFSVIILLGTILGTMGTISFPIGTNMSYFWPAAALQTVGGILFGYWGVAATTLFPSISNALTDGTMSHVLGLLPANFIQSMLPLYFARKYKLSPGIVSTKRDVIIFIVLCATVPHVLGSIVGCVSLYLLGNISDLAGCLHTIKVWIVGNVPCSIIFGYLFLKYIAPVLKDARMLYKNATYDELPRT